MKVCFNIDYHTLWGETVYLSGSVPGGKAGGRSLVLECSCLGGDRWSLETELAPCAAFEYRYLVRDGKGGCRLEPGPAHTLAGCTGTGPLTVVDHWHDTPPQGHYLSSLFGDCLFRRAKPDKPLRPKASAALLRVSAPMVRPGQVLGVCGSAPALGGWDPAKAVAMNDARYPTWEILIDGETLKTPFEYKFVILEKDTSRIAAWEEGQNRVFTPQTPSAEGRAAVISAATPRFATRDWRGAGTAVPVFSLRSGEDFGVGDFFDLKKLADWAAETGQSLLQILPVNDTTMRGDRRDSYPYNANSSFALHPMYLRLSELGRLEDGERRAYYEALADELNALEEVDYERVNRAKEGFTREIFRQNGQAVLQSAEFGEYFKANRFWLVPYAAYSLLRRRFSTADFSRWGEYARYDERKCRLLAKAEPDEFGYVYYLQFNLDRQLRQVRDYARSRGVALKGDIPIGISRHSVDAWTSPELLNLSCQAGAPPDDFSALGQNWGFPPYDWTEMKNRGYDWWKARLGKMSEYFDAYRIDHVLGFFRIWQIPLESVHGLRGSFSPAMALTPQEMRSLWGFGFDAGRHAAVLATPQDLEEIFGDCAQLAKTLFLEEAGGGLFKPKAEFDTQRKVAEYFSSEQENGTNSRLQSGMLSLLDEVLFIEDPAEKGKYHPRIAAALSRAHSRLTQEEKRRFDGMYRDFYYRRHEEFWRASAMEKLPALIGATRMLACAEDLGMIPDCVPGVLEQLQILSLEIQRMPKTPAAEFADTRAYPYRSVCATSTHDMSGLRLWWEEDPDRSGRLAGKVLGESGPAPPKAAAGRGEKFGRMHLDSPSMLCILPLQDWLATDAELRRADPSGERINDPSNPRHYWRYRMHLSLERLLESEKFNARLGEMIASSGR